MHRLTPCHLAIVLPVVDFGFVTSRFLTLFFSIPAQFRNYGAEDVARLRGSVEWPRPPSVRSTDAVTNLIAL